MTESIFTKMGLITSSLLPLFVLTLVRVNIRGDTFVFGECQYFTIFLIICIVIGLVQIIFLNNTSKYMGNCDHDYLEQSEDVSNVNLEFVLTFIIPFVSGDVASIQYLLMFFIILVFIYALMYKSHYYYANPVLFLMGFKVYKIKLKWCEHDCFAICRQSLNIGDPIRFKIIDENVRLIYRVGE